MPRTSVELDVQDAFDKWQGLKRRIEAANIDLDVDVDMSSLAELRQALDRVDGSSVEAKANVDDSEVASVRRDLDELDSLIVTPKVEVDDEAADGFGARLQEGVSARAAGIAGALAAVVAAGVADGFASASIDARVPLRFGINDEDLQQDVQRVTDALNARGIGADRGNVSDAVGVTAQALASLGEGTAELDRLAEAALNLEGSLEVGLNETINAAAQLVRNRLAPDFESALLIVADGLSNTDSRGDDLLDTLNEYSVTLRSLGLDADDALSLFSQGLDAGARDTDKIADAFKELGIRVTEDSEEMRSALASLGLEAISDDIAGGGPAARVAVDQILTEVSRIQDATAQENVIRAIFGAPGEDLTAEVVTALSLTDDAVQDVQLSIDGINESLDTADRQVSGFLRGFREDIGGLLTGQGFGNTDEVSVFDFLTQNGDIDAITADVLDVIDAATERTALRASEGAAAAAAEAAEQFRQQLNFEAFDDRAAFGAAEFAIPTAGLEDAAAAQADAVQAALNQRQLDIQIQADLDEAEFSAAIEAASSLAAEVFGDPFAPKIEDGDITDYVDAVIETQTRIRDFQQNVFAIRAADLFTENEIAILLEIFANAGGAAGADMAAEVAAALSGEGDLDLGELQDSLATAIREADLADAVASAIADLETIGIPATVELDDQALASAQDGFVVDASISVDDSELAAIEVSTLFADVSAVVDLNTAEVDALEQQVLQLNATVNVTDGNGFFGDGISFFDKGGDVHQPTFAVIAERNPEAVVGGHHDPYEAARWLDAVGASEGLALVYAEREAANMAGVLDRSIAAASVAASQPVNVETSALAHVVGELRADNRKLYAKVNELTEINAAMEYQQTRTHRRGKTAAERGLR